MRLKFGAWGGSTPLNKNNPLHPKLLASLRPQKHNATTNPAEQLSAPPRANRAAQPPGVPQVPNPSLPACLRRRGPTEQLHKLESENRSPLTAAASPLGPGPGPPLSARCSGAAPLRGGSGSGACGLAAGAAAVLRLQPQPPALLPARLPGRRAPGPAASFPPPPLVPFPLPSLPAPFQGRSRPPGPAVSARPVGV